MYMLDNNDAIPSDTFFPEEHDTWFLKLNFFPSSNYISYQAALPHVGQTIAY